MAIKKHTVLVCVFGVGLLGCGQEAPNARLVSGCAATRFAALPQVSALPLLFRDCGTRTLSEAEQLLRDHPISHVFIAPSTGAEPVTLADLGAKSAVMVCNLSANRGIIEVPELQPTSQVVTGRSCLPLEGVTKVGALGGRLSSDPKGDGEGGGTEEWFGLALVANPDT